MLDIKLIREQPDLVRQRLATRGAGDETKIDQVLRSDQGRRDFLTRSRATQSRPQSPLQGDRRAHGAKEGG